MSNTTYTGSSLENTMAERENTAEQAMKENMLSLIHYAEKSHSPEICQIIHDLLSTFAETEDCPAYWRNLGGRLSHDKEVSNWIFTKCDFWEFE